jgi:hypothetical protein
MLATVLCLCFGAVASWTIPEASNPNATAPESTPSPAMGDRLDNSASIRISTILDAPYVEQGDGE